MKPQPWSPSKLDDFINCPRAFYAKKVAKTVVEERSEQMIWGERVHKAFEDRLGLKTPLPDELKMHEPYLAALEAKIGIPHTEQQIALGTNGKPTGYFDKDVWCRGIIDLHIIERNAEVPIAWIVDYKTGRPHTKFKQLYLYALWVFQMYPVELCNLKFYWTQTQTETKKVIGRAEIPEIWKVFIPDLKQYAEAFKTDTWQPRPSGLCNGWCPVKDCEFWRPRRK